MTEHWRRDMPQFWNIHELPWDRFEDAEIAHGLDAKLLSIDQDKTSTTLLARFPPGWTLNERADEATVEVLILEGDFSVDAEDVGSGGHAYVPRGSGGCELRSTTGAQALIFLTSDMPKEHGEAVGVERLWQQQWHGSEMPGALHGHMHKSLRLPDVGEGPIHGGPGGCLRLSLETPGFADPREHVHEVWEEMIFLAGDMLMPGRGVIASGSYLGNPEGFWHAPMITQFGSLKLLNTTAPIDQIARDYEGGEALVGTYLDTVSWLETPTHQDWADLPTYNRSAVPAS